MPARSSLRGLFDAFRNPSAGGGREVVDLVTQPARAARPAELAPGAANPNLPPWLGLARADMEAECRRRCQTTYLGDRTVLCRVLGKYQVFADATDVGIMPHLCHDGYWEAWITQALYRFLRPGWACVDVGANHGYYTLLCADAVGPTGSVLACEPNPRVADLLARSLSANGFLERTTLVRDALAERTGAELRLVVPPGRGMNAYLDRAGRDGIPVRTVTLDGLCQSLARVDFVKIDAEGAEEAIWHGMRETVRRNPGLVVLLEFNDGRYADPAAFLASILAEGFLLRHVDFDGAVKAVSPEEVLSLRPNADWNLWLQQE